MGPAISFLKGIKIESFIEFLGPVISLAIILLNTYNIVGCSVGSTFTNIYIKFIISYQEQRTHYPISKSFLIFSLDSQFTCRTKQNKRWSFILQYFTGYWVACIVLVWSQNLDFKQNVLRYWQNCGHYCCGRLHCQLLLLLSFVIEEITMNYAIGHRSVIIRLVGKWLRKLLWILVSWSVIEEVTLNLGQ